MHLRTIVDNSTTRRRSRAFSSHSDKWLSVSKMSSRASSSRTGVPLIRCSALRGGSSTAYSPVWKWSYPRRRKIESGGDIATKMHQMLESRIIASSKPKRAPVCSGKFWEKVLREKIVEDGEYRTERRPARIALTGGRPPFEMRALKFGRSQAHRVRARCHFLVSAQRSFRDSGFLQHRRTVKDVGG
jgi:hypothetical protein